MLVAIKVLLCLSMACSSSYCILLKHSNTIAYYNPGDVLEDKRLRSIAIGNRVITFTQKESLAAFLIALSVKEININSIEEWHKKSTSEGDMEVVW
jgi:carbamoyl-phosphate synthase large subunit